MKLEMRKKLKTESISMKDFDEILFLKNALESPLDFV
jgi:hypothetical protein